MSLSVEDSKYLAEKMGLCWHTGKIAHDSKTMRVYYRCDRCNEKHAANFMNYFSWEQFGEVFEWSKKQEWFDEFTYSIWRKEGLGGDSTYFGFPPILIGPRFVEELVGFLRGMEKGWEKWTVKSAYSRQSSGP